MDDTVSAEPRDEYSDDDFDESEVSNLEGDDADILAEESDEEQSVVTVGDEVALEEETAEVVATEPVEETKSYQQTRNQIHKDIVVVQPGRRRTSNMMSKPELVEAIGIRAAQIAQRPSMFIESRLDDPIAMAKMEIAQRRCPLVLRRVVKRQVDKKTGRITEWVEDWNVNSMIIPSSVKLA